MTTSSTEADGADEDAGDGRLLLDVLRSGYGDGGVHAWRLGIGGGLRSRLWAGDQQRCVDGLPEREGGEDDGRDALVPLGCDGL